MKASDYIVSFLSEKGIHTVFGYIGGMITHLVDSLGNSPNINFVQTYHEQTAAMAAEGYAIESGKFGVAIATSGPGATNMITGIADAYFGNIPVLYITGQVNTNEYKHNKPIRQQGFQETDVVSIVKPITKYAVMIDNIENLCYELEKALYIATEGRKGPVLLDLPMNISRAEMNPEKMKHFTPPKMEEENLNFTDVIQATENSTHPMVLIGGGCKGSETLIEKFIHTNNLPFVTSLMGKGILDEYQTNYMGMIGSYGNRCANMALERVDLLLALGTRLDTRQTGTNLESFISKGKIIHVDIDSYELDHHRLTNRIPVHINVEKFINQLTERKIIFKQENNWHQWLHNLKKKYNQIEEIQHFVQNKSPYTFINQLNEIIKEGDVVTTDVGQNQMWAAQTLKIRPKQKFITSGGLAPMGFSLPVAIGVAFANPAKTIYCLNGDGGLHMAIQSLLLISQYNLNIKVIVLNNSSLGMITQFQNLYFENRMYGTIDKGGYSTPSLEAIAKAYNIPYIKMDENNIDCSVFNKYKYCLLDYVVDGLTTVSPKLEVNKPIYQPSP